MHQSLYDNLQKIALNQNLTNNLNNYKSIKIKHKI